jgi:hypothetical protein
MRRRLAQCPTATDAACCNRRMLLLFVCTGNACRCPWRNAWPAPFSTMPSACRPWHRCRERRNARRGRTRDGPVVGRRAPWPRWQPGGLPRAPAGRREGRKRRPHAHDDPPAPPGRPEAGAASDVLHVHPALGGEPARPRRLGPAASTHPAGGPVARPGHGPGKAARDTPQRRPDADDIRDPVGSRADVHQAGGGQIFGALAPLLQVLCNTPQVGGVSRLLSRDADQPSTDAQTTRITRYRPSAGRYNSSMPAR